MVPLAGVAVKATAEHEVTDILVIAGIGFTVTVTVNVAPVQPLVVGVTVYVAVAFALPELVSVCEILVCAMACALPPLIPAPTGADQV